MALNRDQLEGTIFGILQSKLPGANIEQYWDVAKGIMVQVESATLPQMATVLPATIPTATAPATPVAPP